MYLGCGDLLDVARVASTDESSDGSSRRDLSAALEKEGVDGGLQASPENEEAQQETEYSCRQVVCIKF